MKVSVVVPTTSSRAKFHEAIYECFAKQTHPSVELVVVDSGAAPSPFFHDWLCDARVTYVFCRSDLEPASPTIGAKRNLACAAYGSGDVFAHFDDDDCYAPVYVERLLRALRTTRGARAVKLSSWYVIDAVAVGAAPTVHYFDGARTGGGPARREHEHLYE